MKIIYLLGLLSLFFLNSCNEKTDTSSSNAINTQESQIIFNEDVAVKFINEYVKFCNSNTEITEYSEWIKQQQLLTDSFKSSYYNVIDLSAKLDREMGLDFDPIFDAQDFPEDGFVKDSLNLDSGYVVVKGNNWPEFKLVLKLIIQNGQSLVDGAGVINVPLNKRAKR